MTMTPSSPPSAGASADAYPTITMIVGDNHIDRRVLDQARTLKDAGCDVTVIAAPLPKDGPDSDQMAYPDLRIVRIDSSAPVESFDTSDERLPKALRQDWGRIFDTHDHFLDLALRFEADIYTAHDLPQLPAAGVAAAAIGAYLVFDAHELFPERQFFPPNTTAFLQQLERDLIPLADLVITVNKSIAELMAIRYDIDLPQVVLNCPAVHRRETDAPNENALRRRLGLDDDRCILLYQGGLHDNRNLQLLIPAMRLVENDDVVLVLMGDGGLRPILEEAAAAAGLMDTRVFFLDAVPQDELLQYTASADCGIIPYPHVDLNTYFCTPNKLFEFIVAGLPILANDSPELNRFVSQQGIGMNLPMRSAPEIAAAIDRFFAGNQAEWRETVRELSEQYTWSTESAAFVAAYETLVDVVPNATLNQALYNATLAFRQGQHGEAVNLIRFILDAAPRHIEAHILMSDVALAIEELDTAESMLEAALNIQPRHAIATRKMEQLRSYRQNLESIEPFISAA